MINKSRLPSLLFTCFGFYTLFLLLGVLSSYFTFIGLFNSDYIIYKGDYYNSVSTFPDEPLLHFISRLFYFLGIDYNSFFATFGFLLFSTKFIGVKKINTTFILSLSIYCIIYLPIFDILRIRFSLSLSFFALIAFIVNSKLSQYSKIFLVTIFFSLAIIAHSSSYLFIVPIIFSMFILPHYSSSVSIKRLITGIRLILFTFIAIGIFQIVNSFDILSLLEFIPPFSRFSTYIYRWDGYTGIITPITLLVFGSFLFYGQKFITTDSVYLISSVFFLCLSCLFLKFNLAALQFFMPSQIFYLLHLLCERQQPVKLIFFTPFLFVFLSRIIIPSLL